MGDKDISNKLLVVIAGPTASGKTDVAIQLALHYQTEIINADSRQVYKELNIGVGKPGPLQLELVPHHLIGHASIFQHYSAGHYTPDALTAIQSVFSRNDLAILCGGSGLYIKALLEGFDTMPEVPEKTTRYWTKVWKEQGIDPLIKALEKYDPDYLDVVDRNNYSRLIRAVSISEYTGMPFSSYRKGENTKRLFSFVPIVLELPRKELYARIDQRVVNMIQQGWMEEAKELYPHRHLKALQTVGYKELFEVIEGTLHLEEAVAKIQQATRRYAKRQFTWWRHQGTWNWVHPENLPAMLHLIDQHRIP